MNSVRMLPFLLTDTVWADMTMGEKMKDAAANLVVGMFTVFLVLIFIAWVISLLKYLSIFQKKAEQRKAEKTGGTQAGPLSSAPAASINAAGAAAVNEELPEEELQAVIAAAIAAYEEDVKAVPRQPALNNGIRFNTYRRSSRR